TRCLSDWSSDVCSSDLAAAATPPPGGARWRQATREDYPVRMSESTTAMQTSQVRSAVGAAMASAAALDLRVDDAVVLHDSNRLRSEERRVGKECRAGER